MSYIEPDQRVIESFIAEFPPGKPVTMLNLLKFNAQANYLAENAVDPCTGFEAFIRYGIAVTPLVAAAGGEQVWQGRPVSMLIGPGDEEWDLAALVRYPSTQAFVDMMVSREYGDIAFHRTAALADSRLLAHEEL